MPPGDHHPAILTSVAVVLRDKSLHYTLPHVVATISDYVDASSCGWTVRKARDQGFIHLLRIRLLTPHMNHEGEYDTLSNPYYMRLLWKNAIKSNVKCGDLDELQRLITPGTGDADAFICGKFGTKLVEVATQHGHLHILEWLYANYPTAIEWKGLAVVLGVHFNHLAVVQWLKRIGYEDAPGRVAAERIRHLVPPATMDLAVKKWQQQHGYFNFRREWTLAAASGRLDILQWLHQFEDNSTELEGIFCGFPLAASHGHLHIMQWISETYRRNVSMDEIEQILLPFIDHMCRIAMIHAAREGFFEIVQWLHAHYSSCDYGSRTMDMAAAGGHLEIVQFLHSNRSEGCSDYAMDGAARYGFLEVVKWLHTNRTEGCTVHAMDGAAEYGHLDVILWLHTNRSEGCTTQAMDGAAMNGHLYVVQWLHANRPEGCSPFAMQGAASNGHLEVVQWLHHHYEHAAATLDGPARDGHLEVVKWLQENGYDGANQDALVLASLKGHLSVVQWLFHRVVYPIECIQDAVIHSAIGGQFEVLLFFYTRDVAISKESSSTYFVPKVFDAAAQSDQLEIIRWLYDQYAFLLEAHTIHCTKLLDTESYLWIMERL